MPFSRLPEEVIARVVDKFILQLEAQLADRNVTIELTDEARAWLVKNGYDEAMGARPMARVIQTQIKTPLADEVLFGRLKNGGVVRVVVTGDETGAKKLGFVYPEGPAQPRLERDLIVAAKARVGRANAWSPPIRARPTRSPPEDAGGGTESGPKAHLSGSCAGRRTIGHRSPPKQRGLPPVLRNCWGRWPEAGGVGNPAGFTSVAASLKSARAAFHTPSVGLRPTPSPLREEGALNVEMCESRQSYAA